jgi:hypothetical protein
MAGVLMLLGAALVIASTDDRTCLVPQRWHPVFFALGALMLIVGGAIHFRIESRQSRERDR